VSDLDRARITLEVTRDLVFFAERQVRRGEYPGTIKEYLAEFEYGQPGFARVKAEIDRRMAGRPSTMTEAAARSRGADSTEGVE
jgi:hypothetical protein